MLCQKKNLHESCRMGRRIVVMKLICSIGHSELDGHTVHVLSQRWLTADWLAPRESDCSRMHRQVSSEWLPSFIKAKRPILEVFKTARCSPDRPHIFYSEIFMVIKTVHSNRIIAGKTKCSIRIQKYQPNVCFSRFNRWMTSGVLTHLNGLSLLLFFRSVR